MRDGVTTMHPGPFSTRSSLTPALANRNGPALAFLPPLGAPGRRCSRCRRAARVWGDCRAHGSIVVRRAGAGRSRARLLCCDGLLVYGAGRGIDLTDEIFYLVWAPDPEAYALLYRPFGALLVDLSGTGPGVAVAPGAKATVLPLFAPSAPAHWLAAHRGSYCPTKLPHMTFWWEERALELWRPCAAPAPGAGR